MRKLSSLNQPPKRLLRVVQHCPIMSSALAVKAASHSAKNLSSSSVCPYASTVDALTQFGQPGRPFFGRPKASAGDGTPSDLFF